MITLANAISKPNTVMIQLKDKFVTIMTTLYPWRLLHIAVGPCSATEEYVHVLIVDPGGYNPDTNFDQYVALRGKAGHGIENGSHMDGCRRIIEIKDRGL
ncbi:unnamed protein product [Lathyrus oleraceus]